MRKLHLIIVALLCLSSISRAQSLVQSTDGGSNTFSGSSTSVNLTTSAAGFTNPTTSGDLLVLAVYAQLTYTGTLDEALCAIDYPQTTGFTWIVVFEVAQVFDSSGNSAVSGLFYIPAASSMSGTTTVESSCSINSGPGAITSEKLEFTLYDFNGMSSYGVDTYSLTGNNTGTPSDPGAGCNLSTNAVDMVFVTYTANAGQSNIAAGSGYTLGVNATVAVPGQAQYRFNVPADTYVSCSFGSGLDYWRALTGSFEQTSSPMVPRHKGFVN